MIGLGTIINVVAIVIGASLGVLLGHRLPERTRTVVTDGLTVTAVPLAAPSLGVSVKLGRLWPALTLARPVAVSSTLPASAPVPSA